MIRFADRAEAGRLLAERLAGYAGRPDLLVLALPRGGVPVAAEVAQALAAPLDVFVVRKLGVPGQEELAMGAIASGGVRVLNPEVVGELGLSDAAIETVAAREGRELERRLAAYRGDRPALDATGRAIILVDDGIATGSSIRAALSSLRRMGPERIVVAVPVAPPTVEEELAGLADEVVCLATPMPFGAVGVWYVDFTPTTDDEVRRILERSERPGADQRRI